MTTTSFLPVLQTSDYTSLRGTGSVPSYAGSQYASQCPNTVKFAARFNSAQNGSVGSFAQEEWHSASVGAYTDALYGMRLLASATNDPSTAYFIGRVRKAFGATTAYFNETSIAQNVGDYLFVLDDYPIMDRLLHYLTGSNAYFVDYDIAYRPLRPIIGSANDAIGLKSAYAGFISASSSKFRISLSALFYPSQTAATITAWSLNYLDGTLISGSASGSGTTTGTITLDFPAGFRNILLTCTNSSGQSSTLAIAVWAEVRTGSATLITGFNGSQITLDVSSQSAKQTCSIDVFTSELQSTLDNTLICVWDEEYLNSTLGSVGGNVRFLGRLRKEQNVATPDEHYLRTLVTKYTLEGPDTQLERLDPFNTLGLKEGTSSWGDITVLTPYRCAALLLSEFTTFTNANVMSFDNFDDTFVYPAINTMGNSMLGILNDIGMSINAQMQFAPDGRASFSRHAFYLSNAQRNTINTVANWTDQDRTPGLNITLDQIRNLAQVDAWGGEWIGTPIVVPLHSQAPGLARDIGDKGQEQLLKQILSNVGVTAAQTELNDRAGCHWLLKALQLRLSNLMHPPGYGFLIPDIQAWYTWTISVTDNLRNISYTTATRWILEKVSTTHDNKAGTKTITPTYMVETNGIGFGNTIAIITDNSLPPDIQALALGIYPLIQPIVPPIDIPGPDAGLLKSGLSKLALILNDGTIIKTSNFDQTPPTWGTAISLGLSGTLVRPVPDFFSGRYAGLSSLAYWWMVTATGEYYGSFGASAAPSFSLGHTFRASRLLRSAYASLKAAGHIVVSTDYADGVYTCYGTSGTVGSESLLNATPGTLAPGVFTDINGNVYTSTTASLYKSTNDGSSWSAVSAASTGSDCADSIASSLAGQYLYYGKLGTSFTNSYDFTTGKQGWVSSGDALLSPCGIETTPYVPGRGWGYYTCVTNTSVYAEADFNVSTPLAVTGISATAVVTGTIGGGSFVSIFVDGSPVATVSVTGPGTFTATYSGSTTVNSEISIAVGLTNPVGDGTCYMTAATISNSSAGNPSLQRFDGTTVLDVSPQVGFGPWLDNQISVLPSNPSAIAIVAGNTGQTITGVWISTNGGINWTALVAPSGSNPYTQVFLAGDASAVYLVGTAKIAVTNIGGTSITDKTGNLITSARIVGLAGL